MHNLTIKLASFISEDPNNKDSIQMISYSLEAIFTTLLTTLTALILSFIFQYTKIFVTFSICFISIRMMHKGFHFKKFIYCYIFSNIMIFISCIIIKYYSINLFEMILFYFLIIFHFWVSNEKNIQLSLIITLLFTLFLKINIEISYTLFISVLLDILLIIGRKIQWINSQKESKKH
ncbi:accessory gene regulator B family protein [Candidatus Stoquefichus massiliensis]|uniref:accessory gene regulator B family protein n=1 Tax=Candidatus Stoquefichus massiliensis TaxID=1470350 RepID=UPI0004B440E2